MTVVWIIVGFLFGLALAFYLFISTMRSKMIVEYKSSYNFEETCKRIEEVIPKGEGWGFPIPVWKFYKSQLSKNLTYDNITNCQIYFVCKPKHANTVVSDDPKWSGIMPCSWSVYELKNGDTYIAKMNIALMAMMFTGVLGSVMKEVARDEEKFLDAIMK